MSDAVLSIMRMITDQVWNKGDFNAISGCIASNYILHMPPMPDVVGSQGYRDYVLGVRQAFPDIEMKMETPIVQGEFFACRWSWKGTHRGQSPSLKIPPTGKIVSQEGSTIARLSGDKLVEAWNYADYLGLLQQMGIIPPMG